MQVTEITKPDGSRIVSARTDLEALGHVYPAGEGYSLRLVEGEPGRYGFRISGEPGIRASQFDLDDAGSGTF